jgi:hypothetical protein
LWQPILVAGSRRVKLGEVKLGEAKLGKAKLAPDPSDADILSINKNLFDTGKQFIAYSAAFNADGSSQAFA